MTKIPSKTELKRSLPAYLFELKQITGVDVSSSSLCPIEEVEKLREQALKIADLAKNKFNISFVGKSSERFRKFIINLSQANSNSIYVWTNKSNLYGLYEVASINSIDFSFPFDVNPEGIIVFLTSDVNDKLLLDFYYNSQGEEMIDIELQGMHWSFVPF